MAVLQGADRSKGKIDGARAPIASLGLDDWEAAQRRELREAKNAAPLKWHAGAKKKPHTKPSIASQAAPATALRKEPLFATTAVEKDILAAIAMNPPRRSLATVAVGHIARNCNQGSGYSGYSGGSYGGSGGGYGGRGQTCYSCGGYGHMARDCTQGQKCYNCGEHGHVSRDCTTEGKGERVCYKCKQPGHVQAACTN
ncbi:hypothetical protein LOZ52_001175 [Ophidiomyces ophidiicola]|uniref:Uncharacterized protein n=1 Tax=Ophidiomyces ophidiicola TaxID=1387563 RepID=A0ACB8V8Z5_9EURO|nr:hypothetical protein LOZ64_001108 [Ophidiomyces ophidiicola]KAI1930583.1 hypothetical protein LOZ60_000814 [Ophidiomyces ophidiicola]KAI1985849.1 hypothetical protein LOZ51_006197 [Ophidiomyces ophidiicola]KAI2014092.1 hypothetical protein LOZ49_001610 [Ophidiomyces ophidiicola]KAI2025745.1 hypothetical protein LOZ46_000679 [Ophidiomyces ophidiicola]